MSATQVHFSVSGEALNNIIRDNVLSEDIEHADNILVEGFPELTAQQVRDLIMGKIGFEGVNEFSLVDLNFDESKESILSVYGKFFKHDGMILKPVMEVNRWEHEDMIFATKHDLSSRIPSYWRDSEKVTQLSLYRAIYYYPDALDFSKYIVIKSPNAGATGCWICEIINTIPKWFANEIIPDDGPTWWCGHDQYWMRNDPSTARAIAEIEDAEELDEMQQSLVDWREKVRESELAAETIDNNVTAEFEKTVSPEEIANEDERARRRGRVWSIRD